MPLKGNGTKVGFLCVSNELDFQEVKIFRRLGAFSLTLKLKEDKLLPFVSSAYYIRSLK